jgi:hypothetical protein
VRRRGNEFSALALGKIQSSTKAARTQQRESWSFGSMSLVKENSLA